ncbi:MAG: PKD domain-containing protein [Bacteroidia bacterium]
MKRILILLCLFSLSKTILSQEWVRLWNDTNANFYEIRDAFNEYWKDKPYERGHGYKAFKRWEWFAEPRVYPSGNLKFASKSYAIEQFNKELNSMQKTGPSASTNATVANWIPLGPFGSPAGSGAGRLQVVRTKPGDPNTIYVGTAAGGLWISTNGGTSYSTSTDALESLGVSDIAIHPVNSNTIYISTGDKDAGDTYATGVLKSTDGGATFTQTGLLWTTDMKRRIYRLLIDPVNPNNLYVASSVGIYKSTDAGATWNQISTSYSYDMEFKPNDPNTIYAVGSSIFIKSTNGGSSFTSVNLSASPNSNRLALAVTPADNNRVYVLASAQNNGFGGLYESTNAGNSFTLKSSTPNIFDWSTNGSGSGGQGWYDIDVAASPTNANVLIAGGVNTWRSTNGGTTWSLHTHWYGGGGKPYVHADLHSILFVTGNTILLGTDGGVARTTNGGSSYTEINGNMNIAQIYKLGNSANLSDRIVTGHQDNGTNLLTGSNWNEIYGGDGMDCFISWGTNNTIIASYVYGDFQRSTNGGGNWTNIVNGLTGTAAWLAPIVQDPINANTYYCGYQRVFKTTNQGTSWVPLGNNIGATLDEIYVCPNNNNYIYVTSSTGIWRSTNGGNVWSNVTSGLPVGSAQITDVTCDNTNPDNVWVTLSGYQAGTKVYMSIDGGTTWTNYSTGLPNIPANCIIYENNSPHKLYVGTDVGVYYREASMNSWINFSNGMPNVVVSELEIFYPGSKLRAATYGRSVYETSLYSNPTAAPSAFYSVSASSLCINQAMTFNDLSANSPTSWNWTFSGGNPSSSTAQNPSVTYTSSGVYTVTLISANANGTSTPYVSTISVVNMPTVAASNTAVCAGNNVVLTLTTNATTGVWSNGSNGLTLVVPSITTSAVYGYTVSLGACKLSGNSSITVNNAPAQPVVIVSGPFLTTTTTAQSYQWYLNGSPILGATSVSYTPTQDGWHTLYAYDNGCPSSSNAMYITLTELEKNAAWLNGIKIGPIPVVNYLVVERSGPWLSSKNGQIQLLDINGKQLLTKSLNESEKALYINLENYPSGTYILKVISEDKESRFKVLKN